MYIKCWNPGKTVWNIYHKFFDCLQVKLITFETPQFLIPSGAYFWGFHSCSDNWSVRLREKCPYSELFWSAFSRIRIEYGEILLISPYSVGMQENADQNNSEYGHFLYSANSFLRVRIKRTSFPEWWHSRRYSRCVFRMILQMMSKWYSWWW